jgi:PAS domain S-box-containing protein
MHGSDDAEREGTKLRAELHDVKTRLSQVLEKQLQDETHRQRLYAIVEASRDAIWSWSPEGIIMSWNAEAERLFQYRADEIIGKSLLTLVPSERLERAQVAVDRLRSGGWYDQYETVRVRKDGVQLPVELTVSPIRNSEGAVTGIATVCRDITMRRRYEEALRESEERFSKVFRLSPVAMSISTLDEGRYIDVNDSLLEITGYARDEIVGRTARDLHVFADPADGARIRSLLASGEPVQGLELGLRGKGGDIRTSLLAADIIELKDKKCLLTASVDITERKQREATLQFLDTLGRQTAPLADADAILAVTTRMLGEHLGVAVCAHADMDADQDGFTIRGNWSAPGSMSIVGHYSLAAFGKLAVSTLRAGLPLILNDNRAQLLPEEAATFLSIGLAATICMPLVKEGRLTALMAIHDRRPRVWTASDLSTLREVTERSWAHIERVKLVEDLRASEARYRGAVITGRIAAWETNMLSRTRIWTDEGMELFGLDLPGGRGQVGGEKDEFWRSLHPDDKHMMAEFHRTADRVDSYPAEYRIVRPDGAILWVSGRGRVVARGPDGKAQRVLNIVMDVTERKRAEEHIQLLMREISHRSKNLLSVVQAIAGQTGRAAGTFPDFQEAFAQRLRGLAASHEILVENEWRGALLRDLAHHQLALFTEAGEHRLSLSGPDAMLTTQAAQAIGLALHELGTNALKYGAWSVPDGSVGVSWAWEPATHDANRLQLTWVERGGPAVRPPGSRGFGRVVTEFMVAQTTGGEVSMEFRPAGLTWTLSIPGQNFALLP